MKQVGKKITEHRCNISETFRDRNGPQIALIAAAVIPFLIYLWSNSQAVYEYSGAVNVPLFTAFRQDPKFFIKFLLKSFASMVFGVELIDRNFAGIPGKYGVRSV